MKKKPRIPGHHNRAQRQDAIHLLRETIQRRMTGVAPETAARFVGCLATLREVCIPEICNNQEVRQRDPKLVRLLYDVAGRPDRPDEQGKLGEVLDRLFLLDAKLEVDTRQVIDRRVLALDIGQLGTMMAFDMARKAFEEARSRPGAPPARESFTRALAKHMGIKMDGEDPDQDEGHHSKQIMLFKGTDIDASADPESEQDPRY